MNEELPIPLSPELEMLRLTKEDGYDYRERRHEDWLENYTLYRDKVMVNRLVQRQSVNIPLMKQTIRTLLKDVDDMPVIYFENLDNDKTAEVFQNEYWKVTQECNNMDLQDIVDKRQVFLFGRSFDQWQIVDGKVKMTIQDPQDISVSRYTDPTNIHSSRFLIHEHIYVPFSSLEKNTDYDQKEIENLKLFYATNQGLIKSEDNQNSFEEKNLKLARMGVSDVDSPVLGETYVELTLYFMYRDNEKDAEGNSIEEQLFLYTVAEDMVILQKKPLEEIIGVTKDHWWRNHFPYNSWADDVERQDFWSDSIADIVRTPNKVLNSWFSQLVENRTLRNFGMHYYNSMVEGFTPNAYQPIPFGWYGVPVPEGKSIQDMLQKVDIPDLSESLDEMAFVLTMTEKATGATATQQGVQNDRQVTLGEVKLALGEAKERIKGMSKFYTPVWKQRGETFLKMIEAGADKLDAVKIYKKGRNSSELYQRDITPQDYLTKSGYVTRVWSQDEKNTEDMNSLQKLNAVKQVMPGNFKVQEIYERRLLEFANLKPDEINDIMEEQQQQRDALAASQGAMDVNGMPTQNIGALPAQAMPPQTPMPGQVMQ